jgi:hypothetical protein
LDDEPDSNPYAGYSDYAPIFTPPGAPTDEPAPPRRSRVLCTPAHAAGGRDLCTPAHPRRGRGAPAGNHNAIKHGFYSRFYKKAELTDMTSLEPLDLANEIEIMRVYIRRTIENDTGSHDFNDTLAIMRCLSLATYSLTRLIRTQQIVSPPQDFATQVRKSMGSVLDEWRYGEEDDR